MNANDCRPTHRLPIARRGGWPIQSERTKHLGALFFKHAARSPDAARLFRDFVDAGLMPYSGINGNMRSCRVRTNLSHRHGEGEYIMSPMLLGVLKTVPKSIRKKHQIGTAI